MAVVIAPPRRDQFFDKDGQPTLRFIKWIENLTVVTNNTTNEVTEVIESHGGAASSAEVHEKFNDNAQIEDLIPTDFNSHFESLIVRVDKTLVDRDYADIRNGSTVTLDANAQHNAQIITANGDGTKVKIISTIEMRVGDQRGYTTTINNEGTALHWHLFENGLEQFWRPR